jgi:hypothetical protein
MLSLDKSLAITAPVPIGNISFVTVPASPNKGTPKLAASTTASPNPFCLEGQKKHTTGPIHLITLSIIDRTAKFYARQLLRFHSFLQGVFMFVVLFHHRGGRQKKRPWGKRMGPQRFFLGIRDKEMLKLYNKIVQP